MKFLLKKYFPFIGSTKRFLIALLDSIFPNKKSYSQFKEDIIFLEEISKCFLPQKGNIYIDVGAFAPSQISNTYLLYRNGYNGILIEPNFRLYKLLSYFRRKDIIVNAGAGNKSCITNFNISYNPDRSSLLLQSNESYRIQTFIPVLSIDDFLSNIEYEYVTLLSIDVEGQNLSVLKGSTETLRKTFLICIEFDNEIDIAQYLEILSEDFVLIKKIKCNLIFKNKKFL